MSDERVRRAWLTLDYAARHASRIGRAFLDAWKDVRGAPPPELLDRLDCELRRAGDGPYLPVVVFRGLDVYINGRRQLIVPLESFAVTLNMQIPPPTPFLERTLNGILIRSVEAEEK